MTFKVLSVISGRGLDVYKDEVESLDECLGMEEEEVVIGEVFCTDEADVIVGNDDISWEELEQKFLDGNEELYEGNEEVMESVRKGIRMAEKGKIVSIL